MNDILNGLPTVRLTPEQEAALVRREDYETLALHNMREAFLYARTCFPVLDEGELFSACYEALVESARSFRPGGIRFFAHAKQAIRGTLGRRWKSQKQVVKGSESEPLIVRNDSDEDLENLHCYKEPPEPSSEPDFGGIDLRERWAELRPIISSLNLSQRMILALKYQGGLNFSEIAHMLGLVRATCQHHAQQALLRIRNELLDQGKFKR